MCSVCLRLQLISPVYSQRLSKVVVGISAWARNCGESSFGAEPEIMSVSVSRERLNALASNL